MASPFKSINQRIRSWFTTPRQRPARKLDKRLRLQVECLEERTVPSVTPAIGDVFVIDMENHNLTQPSNVTSPQQLLNNPAAPYLNSLMTPGNPNAAQTSYASNYNNVGPGIHPSEPNYVWQEGGSNFGVVGNDDDPYANNGNSSPLLNNNVKLIAATGDNPGNLSGLLQAAGISWKSYQEDIDLTPSSGSVNQPGANALTSTVAPQNQWTVPTTSFSGTAAAYTNPYNGSDQYNFAVKHDGQLFYTATNGGTLSAPNFSPSNPEAQYYAPLQQLETDLNNNTVAAYNQITPDQFNDMHSSLNTNFTYNGVTYTHNTDQEAVALGDNFLSIIVPEIEASQAYKNNGAIVIWYDETEGGDTSAFTLPEIVISPLAKGNAYDSTLTYTHSSDLKSLQELFGVTSGGLLAGAGSPGTNDLWDMFKFSPRITTTAGPAVTLGNAATTTLSDSAVLANGSNETGNLVFTLTGPGGFSYTQNVPVSSNGTYTASDAVTTSTILPGTYTWSVSYAGDANNFAAQDQGGAAEQTVVTAAAQTLAGDVLILDQTDDGSLNETGNASLNVSGTLQVDSNSAIAATLSGHANASAGQIDIVGGYQFSKHASFDPIPTTNSAFVADPLSFLSAPTSNSPTGEIKLSGHSTATILPGNYSSITVSGNAQLTLAPGTYIVGFGGIKISGNASVTGTGVLIYNSGAFTVSGNASVNLTAPVTGEYAGLVIFQDPNNSNGVTVSGNADLNLNGGLLYDSNASSVDRISGNASVEASLDVNELAITGNASETAA